MGDFKSKAQILDSLASGHIYSDRNIHDFKRFLEEEANYIFTEDDSIIVITKIKGCQAAAFKLYRFQTDFGKNLTKIFIKNVQGPQE